METDKASCFPNQRSRNKTRQNKADNQKEGQIQSLTYTKNSTYQIWDIIQKLDLKQS